MHILVISEFWLPEEWGGGERSAYELCKGLASQGIEVTVLTSASSHAPVEERMDGVRVLRTLRSGKPTTWAGNLRRAVSFQRSALRAAIELCKTAPVDGSPVDIIHLMNTSSIPLAPALKHSTGKTVTAHCNSPLPFCPKGDRMRYGCREDMVGAGCSGAGCEGTACNGKECGIVCDWNAYVPCLRASGNVGKAANPWWVRENPLAWRALWRTHQSYRDAFGSVTAWASIGTGLSRLLTMHGVPASTITLLPNPVDTTSLRSLKLPAPKKTLRVGYIGQLSTFKGVQVLAEALEGLPAEVRVELHVAGEGPLAERLTHMGSTVMHGRVPASGLAQFYSLVDVVVIPSVWPEGFGRVAVEAMAAGRAVIASDNGGLRDIIGGGAGPKGGGRLVPAGDVEALRREILVLAKKPSLCATRGRLCRKHVEGVYEGKAIAKKFAAFFKQK